MSLAELVAEARRDLEICNACRYCEGYCAVFPAMTLRRAFTDGDVHYLANLCHNCKGCFHACQYAPPHEFALNLPAAFAEVRLATYAEYAWPRPLAAAFQKNGLVMAAVTTALVVAVLAGAAALNGASLFELRSGPGAFYRVIPWAVMAGLAGATFLFAAVALTIGAVRFVRAAGQGRPRLTARGIVRGLHDAVTLKYLGGGAADGCNDAGPGFTHARRWLHHLMAGGFVLCFASTAVATLYHHLLGRIAPYPLLSLPVVLGTLGGLGLVAGTGGLIALKLASDRRPVAERTLGADYALLVLLFVIAATGLKLLVLRDTAAMGVLLAVHLGVVLSFFALAPYSKFVHAAFRAIALMLAAEERADPLAR